MSNSIRGLTLVELLVAAAAGAVVLAALVVMFLAQLRIGNALRASSPQQDETLAAMAALYLAKQLERADRIVILNTGDPGSKPFRGGSGSADGPDGADIMLRTLVTCPAVAPLPPSDPACFDSSTNYRWLQLHRHPANSLLWFGVDAQNRCQAFRLADGITSFRVHYVDAASAPPGGDPPFARFSPSPEDNNVVEYSLTWDNGLSGPDRRSHTFRGAVTSRQISYSDVNAGAAGDGDSGFGPAAPGVNDAPAGPWPCYYGLGEL